MEIEKQEPTYSFEKMDTYIRHAYCPTCEPQQELQRLVVDFTSFIVDTQPMRFPHVCTKCKQTFYLREQHPYKFCRTTKVEM